MSKLPDNCPKCGNAGQPPVVDCDIEVLNGVSAWEGPYYRTTVVGRFKDWLGYSCTKCGYETQMACKDDE